MAVGLGMVGKDAGDDVGGCRSSGELGVVARRHGRRSWWWLRATEVAVSTTVGSGASCGGCGHGHAMAGGEKLSAAVVSTATAALQGKGEGKSVQGLTGIMQGGSASSGKHERRRIDDEVDGGRRLKMSLRATLQGFRRAVDRWGGRGGRGGAPEPSGRARGGRWPRRTASVAMAAFGRVRERKQRRGGPRGE